MILAERASREVLPPWTVGFLRERGYDLQCHLVRGVDREVAEQAEADAICAWTDILVAAADLGDDVLTILEELQLLHARVVARLERGGVADLSGSVEALVTSLLVDQLQSQTRRAITAVADAR